MYLASANKLNDPIMTNNLNITNDYINNCLHSGYIPTEALAKLDNRGLLQNSDNVPILYHAPRHQYNKRITHSPHIDQRDNANFKYSRHYRPVTT